MITMRHAQGKFNRTCEAKSIHTGVLCAVMSLCMIFIAAFTVKGAPPVTVSASLDTTTILMGKTTGLNLKVEKSKDVRGYFPILTDSDSRPYFTLLDDTIEISKNFKTDTLRLANGNLSINYRMPVQVFDAGYYKLPPFLYVAGTDSVFSNSVTLNVVPVAAEAVDEINDYSAIADAPPASWLDNLPDWVVEYWWALLIGVILLAVIIYLVIYGLRHRTKKPARVVYLPPYEEAMCSLQALKSKELWQNGNSEHYFVELTSILRRYLSRRFNVSAPEMTTTQFLEEASRNPVLVSHNTQLRRLLELADFIKFAKGQSLPDENEEAFNIVLNFVMSTRPTKEEQDAMKAAIQESGQPSKQGSLSKGKREKARKPNKKVAKRKEAKK